MTGFTPPEGEKGAALLTVLLLVAVMGALAMAALERMRLATTVAQNGALVDQARYHVGALESLAVLAIDDLLAAGNGDASAAVGTVRQVPLPGGGLAEAKVRDGGNCFNLNSVATGGEGQPLASNPIGIAELAGLLRVLGVPQGDAARIADAAGDWVDADTYPNSTGAEDSYYQQADVQYRTPNAPFADASELRAVAGVTPDIYERAKPFLCALPDTKLSALNINTLTPDQAPLIAMLAPERIPLETARRVLMARPAGGWGSAADFWNAPGLKSIMLPLDVQSQPQLKTEWFALDIRVTAGEAGLVETALVDARKAPARVAMRRWGSDE
ncbi:MAG TPA: type II secretion system minor pseudopilin GspK [Allosphingosinicella sp.]